MREEGLESESNEFFDSAADYLRKSIKKLIFSKMAGNRRRKIEAERVSSRLVEVLRDALTSEKERGLQELMVKLNKLKAEKHRLEQESSSFEDTASLQKEEYLTEHETLEKQNRRLDRELRALETKQLERHGAKKRELVHQQREVHRLDEVIALAQSTQRNLAQEIEEIRSLVLNMERKQSQLCSRAKELCIRQLSGGLTDAKISDSLEESPEFSALRAQRNSQKDGLTANEKTCQQLLSALWTLHSNKPHPKITVKNFVERLPELKQWLNETMEYNRELAVSELQEEVRKSLPGVRFDRKTIIESVNKYVEEKTQETEEEYQQILRKGEKRERKLRERLQSTIEKLEKVEKENSSRELLSDLERIRIEYGFQRRNLDEKMRELKRKIDVSGSDGH
jgi:hypothetical protein